MYLIRNYELVLETVCITCPLALTRYIIQGMNVDDVIIT